MQPLSNFSSTLYDKYGVQTITAIVNDCYNRILSDSELASYFVGVDMNVLRKHQVLFLSYILGSKRSYNGANLKSAHTNLSVTEEHFNRFIQHIDDSCRYFNLDLEDRAAFVARMRTLKYFIVHQ
ncbi:group 1 truncated hemoglobin [Shimazuella sp. AN120528]|uniref:group I truncated hemoglobin n=1 Tax=Shimazuella soli TaxID=1892854 RepID=UPI001F112697|nr:group 1 truncated hemoglobin [Shimazuella soli]MCH5585496.1 group 1 truncated hemoglobin [Shimazuella soli]